MAFIVSVPIRIPIPISIPMPKCQCRGLQMAGENQPRLNLCNKQNFNTKEKHGCNIIARQNITIFDSKENFSILQNFHVVYFICQRF